MSETILSNPDTVQVHRITTVSKAERATGNIVLVLSNKSSVVLTGAQVKDYLPIMGDYYVVPSSGPPWCAPAATFRKTYIVP